MHVFLDDRAIGGEAASLAEALRAGVAAAERVGRMIVEVQADGERVSDEVLGDPARHPASIGEIRLLSADPVAMVADALKEAGLLLVEAKGRQGDAATAFVTGDLGAGTEHLKAVVGAWQSVQDAVSKSAAVLGIDLGTLEFQGGDGEMHPARDEIAGLAALLNDLLGAVSRQDWSASADVLDYDLAGAADLWGAMIRRLGEVAAERRG